MKSLIVLGFLAAVLNFAAAGDYNKALQDTKEAFPGIIQGTPEVITVEFDNGVFMDLGKNITPTETINQPKIDWNADKDSYYTLVVVDPDAPSRDDTYMRDVLPWLVGNIPGNDINSGEVLFEYISAAPPRNMGMNRYFFFIFKQPSKLIFDEKRTDKYTVEGRLNFSLQNFATKYELGSPVGFNFDTTYWDPSSNEVYRQLNCFEFLM